MTKREVDYVKLRKGAPTRTITKALRDFVERHPDAIDGLVRTLYSMAVEDRNLNAISLIYDRLEGKVRDKIDITSRKGSDSIREEIKSLSTAIKRLKKDEEIEKIDANIQHPKSGRPKKT